MIVTLIIYTLLIVTISAVLHEVGHIIALSQITGQKMSAIKLYYYKGSWHLPLPKELSKEDKNYIILIGLLGGIIPYLFLLEYVSGWVVLAIIIIYLSVGARNDIKKLFESHKKLDRED